MAHGSLREHRGTCGKLEQKHGRRNRRSWRSSAKQDFKMSVSVLSFVFSRRQAGSCPLARPVAVSSGGGVGVAFQGSWKNPFPGSTKLAAATTTNAPSSCLPSSRSAPGVLIRGQASTLPITLWRKLHSDPLLFDSPARSRSPLPVEASKEKDMNHDRKEHQKKHSHSKGKHHKHSSKLQSDSENFSGEGERWRKTSDHKHSSSKRQSDSEDVRVEGEKRRKTSDRRSSKYDEHHYKAQVDSDGELSERENQRGRNSYRGSKYRERSPRGYSHPKAGKIDVKDTHRKDHGKSMNERYSLEGRTDFDADRKGRDANSSREARSYASSESVRYDSNYKRRNVTSKLTEEERLAKLREMQVDAELHEEQRWKRLRKAEEDDAREATHTSMLGGRNFLDAAHKSVYGAEKGGSSTIEESVRRRAHYSQGRTEVGDGNAFRR
ncbi:hypothetical protein NC653_015212 [Populus alba x Populus x berolinensis]|uniref:Uncharacterized protein n=1 Tax=Populus alba x Populus x berolinensis TaxID=444605 RepID=A0AAD6QJX6_9ROSI|nr:hypothetical protein NC653_015212 [Populus alba x Populus x berolinensis]